MCVSVEREGGLESVENRFRRTEAAFEKAHVWYFIGDVEYFKVSCLVPMLSCSFGDCEE